MTALKILGIKRLNQCSRLPVGSESHERKPTNDSVYKGMFREIENNEQVSKEYRKEERYLE